MIRFFSSAGNAVITRVGDHQSNPQSIASLPAFGATRKRQAWTLLCEPGLSFCTAFLGSSIVVGFSSVASPPFPDSVASRVQRYHRQEGTDLHRTFW